LVNLPKSSCIVMSEGGWSKFLFYKKTLLERLGEHTYVLGSGGWLQAMDMSVTDVSLPKRNDWRECMCFPTYDKSRVCIFLSYGLWACKDLVLPLCQIMYL